MKPKIKTKIENLANQYRSFVGDYRRKIKDNEVMELLEAEAKSIDEKISYYKHYELIKYGILK